MHIASVYCELEIFANFIFSNSLKRHSCNVKTLHDLHVPTSINMVNDRVISPFHVGFIFTKHRICEISRK